MDNVLLEFNEDALVSIAEEAITRNTGARGLRAILEEIMKDIMFDIPSKEEISKVTITNDTVKTKQPEIELLEEGQKRTMIKGSKRNRSKRGPETA